MARIVQVLAFLCFVLLAGTARGADLVRHDNCSNGLQEILRNATWNRPLPPALQHLLRGLDKAVRNKAHIGNAGQLVIEPRVYLAIASMGPDCVRTICEIGFNAGHSAAMWLFAAPTAHVYMFDLWYRPQANEAGQRYIETAMPGARERLHILKGNSKYSVMDFHSANPLVKCDIISVDGGHDYEDAYVDLQNMWFLANPEFHVLFLDDTNCEGPWCDGVMKALRAHEAQRRVRVLEGWSERWGREKGACRGLTVLQYIK